VVTPLPLGVGRQGGAADGAVGASGGNVGAANNTGGNTAGTVRVSDAHALTPSPHTHIQLQVLQGPESDLDALNGEQASKTRRFSLGRIMRLRLLGFWTPSLRRSISLAVSLSVPLTRAIAGMVGLTDGPKQRGALHRRDARREGARFAGGGGAAG
jgi:hypothetical protein